MDWNFKPNSGCLSEFDQESISNISPIEGSSNFRSSGPRASGEFSFDLKLGPVCNNSNSRPSNGEATMNEWKEAAGAKSESSSGSGSLKRARGGGNRNQTAYCLVDGCNKDLSNCREYHRRHKVCEVHSKTAVVTIKEQKQRFCQQCSRFHSLEEFDEGKRSCRKRLDGHNRRRRKPQAEPVHRPPSFFSHFQGNKMLQFSGSQVFPTTTVVSSSWASGVVSGTASTVSYVHSQNISLPAKPGLMFPVSSPSSSYRGGRHFPFLQDESPVQNPAIMLCDRLPSCIRDSDCALSLLSSSSSQHRQSHNIGLSNNLLPQPLPLGSSPVDSVLVSGNSGDDAAVYGSGLFQNTAASDGSASGNETASQTFPFHWE